MTIEIFLDGIILAFLFIALLICIGILFLIVIFLRPLTSNVPILLTCNTYLALILTCIMMIIIYIYNLYGDINPFVSVEDSWCQLRAYFVNVGFCALYYSCVLQSIFRFFRIIFYKFKILQSSQFFSSLIIIKWFLSFILILSNYLGGDYQYLPLQYRCWISFQNTRGLLLAACIIYGSPLFIIFFIYTYIVRQMNQMQQKRLKSIKRDLLVLKRIAIFVLVVIGIGLPTVSILFIYMFTSYLIPMAYHLQGLSMGIGVFIATICFAFITPQIQEIFNKKQEQVHSPMFIRSHPSINTQVILLEQVPEPLSVL
jgi:hypothetical protein